MGIPMCLSMGKIKGLANFEVIATFNGDSRKVVSKSGGDLSKAEPTELFLMGIAICYLHYYSIS